MVERFLGDKIALHAGDCMDVLARLDECSIDACVTDPPYHLTSIVKRFAKENPEDVEHNVASRKTNGQGISPYARTARGFMGKQWDGGDIAFRPELWAAVYRVLKPGAHLVAMGGTRTYHRLACAIEDAGFEIRDTISWLYGSGFPKSHDVSKGIDRAAGAKREVIRERYTALRIKPGATVVREGGYGKQDITFTATDTAPATPEAAQWHGWGTALKPACELIVLARKPLSEGTVAANVLRWGTGAINVDGCRVEGVVTSNPLVRNARGFESNGLVQGETGRGIVSEGRWPANLVHDGSEEVVAAFPETNQPGGWPVLKGQGAKQVAYGEFNGSAKQPEYYADSGSAARFFYTAKADADDRLGSKHPTVKPVDLMQWLVRLVTPKGGTVLDPFAGTGTTGEAAFREGMRAVLIEHEAEYQEDIRRRMALALAGPDERVRESIKARGMPIDYGPLFGGIQEAAE